MGELYMASLKISPSSFACDLQNVETVLWENQAESFIRNGLDIQQ